MSRWSEPDRREIARLWNEGWSSSRIGKRFGVTRNVIIGFVSRHGQRYGCMDGRLRPSVPEPSDAAPPRPKPQRREKRLGGWAGGGAYAGRRVRAVALEPLPGAPEPIGLMERGPFMCCFPVAGEGVETLYCGAPTVRSPHWQYCDAHLKRMGQAPEALRKHAIDTGPIPARRAA